MMNKLTISQKDSIQKAIEQRCPYVCNGCRKGNFTLLAGVIRDYWYEPLTHSDKATNVIRNPEAIITQSVYNICDNCGLVRQHALKPLGIDI
jgi:hypothetical protein